MGSPRIKGNALRLTIGAADYWADATSVVMVNETETTEDIVGELIPAKARWYFDVTAIQSTAPTSLWTYLFDHSFDLADYTYAPHGNETATLDHPHFTGTLQLGAPPALGGNAGENVQYTFTTRLPVRTGPNKVTG